MSLVEDFAHPDSVVRQEQQRQSFIAEDMRPLYRDGRRYPAIPFFGRFDQADILTLGLNPSSHEVVRPNITLAEFVDWPDEVFLHCCYSYFENEAYCEWFNRWSPVLQHFGVSYLGGENGRAAHVDLSPRPTCAASTLLHGEHRQQFEEVIAGGAQTLFHLISQYRPKAPRLVISGGKIQGLELIQRLLGIRPIRIFNQTPGAWSLYHWPWPNGQKIVPVLSCTTGPSAWTADRVNMANNFFRFVVPYLAELGIQ